MARPLKTLQTPNLRDVIKEAAWRQISGTEAPSLSLRRIARDIGITAPAIYNYFSDRDALVTELIIDAYTSFGDCQLAARTACPEPGLEIARLKATGLAYRNWALDHPQRYLLIFGNPVAGYVPPMQEILPAMMRSLSALTDIVGELHGQGRLDVEGVPLPVLEPDHRFFSLMETTDSEMLAVYAVAMLIWSRVHGLVSLEITGQQPPFGDNGAALYLFELDSICRQFVKSPQKPKGSFS